MNKICLFYTSNLTNKIIYYELIKEYPSFFNEVIEFPISNSINQKIVHKIKKSGLKFIFFQFLINFYFKFLNNIFGVKIKNLCKKKNIKYSFQKKIDKKLINKLRKKKYDFIFNGQNTILKKNILNNKVAKFINCHCAPLPNFRGPANYIWLILKKSMCYPTIHVIDETIDGGEIIDYGKKVSYKKFKSVFSLWYEMRLSSRLCIKKNIEFFLGQKKSSKIKLNTKNIIRTFPKKKEINKINIPFLTWGNLIYLIAIPFKD